MSEIRLTRQNTQGAGERRKGRVLEGFFVIQHEGCGGEIHTDTASRREQVDAKTLRWMDCRCTNCDALFTVEAEATRED